MNRRHFLQCSTASLGLFATKTSYAITPPPDKRSASERCVDARLA